MASELGKFRRVNYAWIQKSTGQEVALVGKVLNVGQDVMTVQTSDGKEIKVHRQSGSANYEVGAVVEFVGKVNSDFTLVEHKSTAFSDSFDFSTYNSLVDLSNGRMSHLFN